MENILSLEIWYIATVLLYIFIAFIYSTLINPHQYTYSPSGAIPWPLLLELPTITFSNWFAWHSSRVNCCNNSQTTAGISINGQWILLRGDRWWADWVMMMEYMCTWVQFNSIADSRRLCWVGRALLYCDGSSALEYKKCWRARVNQYWNRMEVYVC